MLQAEDSKYGVHAKKVSQPCDTVHRRRLALRQDCDFMHTLFSDGFTRLRICGNAMDVCIGTFGAALLALLRYAGVVDLPGLTLSSTVVASRLFV